MKPPMMIYVSLREDGLPSGVTKLKDEADEWSKLEPDEPIYMYQLIKRVHPKQEKKGKKS